MSLAWQLQEAKNRLSEVVDRALAEGPQVVTRRGEAVVVVVSYEEWKKKTGARPSFKDFLRKAPIADLDLTREQDAGREIDLS